MVGNRYQTQVSCPRIFRNTKIASMSVMFGLIEAGAAGFFPARALKPERHTNLKCDDVCPGRKDIENSHSANIADRAFLEVFSPPPP